MHDSLDDAMQLALTRPLLWASRRPAALENLVAVRTEPPHEGWDSRLESPVRQEDTRLCYRDYRENLLAQVLHAARQHPNLREEVDRLLLKSNSAYDSVLRRLGAEHNRYANWVFSDLYEICLAHISAQPPQLYIDLKAIYDHGGWPVGYLSQWGVPPILAVFPGNVSNGAEHEKGE